MLTVTPGDQTYREQLRLDTMASYADFQATELHVADEEMDAWFEKFEAGEDAPPPDART
jgi:hypothetical protein